MGRVLKRYALKDFKAAAKDGADVASATIAKSFATVCKVEGEADSRVRSFVVSDASVDRDGDTVDPSGWDLGPFRKSGTVLWAHDGRLPPVATPIRTFVEGDQLIGHAKFASQDMPHPMGEGFGHTVMRMFDEGLMRAVSAGFLPLEFSFDEERGGFMPTNFKRQELLEWSPVPVPSNRNAIVQARGLGIDVDSMIAWAETERDAGSVLVPKSMLVYLLDSVAGNAVVVELKSEDADDEDPVVEVPELDPGEELPNGEDDQDDTVDEDEAHVAGEGDKKEDDSEILAGQDPSDTAGFLVPAVSEDQQTPAQVYAAARDMVTKAESDLIDSTIELLDAIADRGSFFSEENEDRLSKSIDALTPLLKKRKLAPNVPQFLVELIESDPIQEADDDDGIDFDPAELRGAIDLILAKHFYQLTGKLPQ